MTGTSDIRIYHCIRERAIFHIRKTAPEAGRAATIRVPRESIPACSFSLFGRCQGADQADPDEAPGGATERCFAPFSGKPWAWYRSRVGWGLPSTSCLAPPHPTQPTLAT